MMNMEINDCIVVLSYNKLWKKLIDENLTKTGLREKTGIGTGTLSKLSKNEPVSIDVLAKICVCLRCDIGDILEVIYD